MNSAQARAAREEGMDRLLAKHELYCTVCENHNGDCTLHNTMVDMQIPIQRYGFSASLTPRIPRAPFILTILISASCAGAVWRRARMSRSMKRFDNGRLREHFQGTNQTGRSAGIRQQRTPLAGPQLPL